MIKIELLLSLFYSFLMLQCDANSSDNDIVFSLPDLVTDYDADDGSVHLEAFKSFVSDKILKEDPINPRKYGQLMWVSIGDPILFKSKAFSTHQPKLFHFSDSGFFTKVEMLTKKQRDIFMDIVKQKYNVDLKTNQIVNLILSRFECTLQSVHKNEKFFLKGVVTQMHQFPLRLNFEAPIGTKDRTLMELAVQQMGDQLDLTMNCQLSAMGRVVRENSLVISLAQISQLNLIEDLFGLSNTSIMFVSRQQLGELASQMFSKLNIVEDYQLPAHQFSAAFIDDLIKQTATTALAFTPIDQVLDALSKFDMSEDIRPDVIKTDLGRVFKIKSINGKEHIVVSEDYTEATNNSGSSNQGGEIGGSVRIFSAKAAYNHALSHHDEWLKKRVSIDNQLRELNNLQLGDVEWKREGQLIVPKSLRVACFNRALFSKDIVISRVRREVYEASFNRKVSLHTLRVAATVRTDTTTTTKNLDTTTELTMTSKKNITKNQWFGQSCDEYSRCDRKLFLECDLESELCQCKSEYQWDEVKCVKEATTSTSTQRQIMKNLSNRQYCDKYNECNDAVGLVCNAQVCRCIDGHSWNGIRCVKNKPASYYLSTAGLPDNIYSRITYNMGNCYEKVEGGGIGGSSSRHKICYFDTNNMANIISVREMDTSGGHGDCRYCRPSFMSRGVDNTYLNKLLGIYTSAKHAAMVEDNMAAYNEIGQLFKAHNDAIQSSKNRGALTCETAGVKSFGGGSWCSYDLVATVQIL